MVNNALENKPFQAKIAFAFGLTSLICVITRILVLRLDLIESQNAIFAILFSTMLLSGIVGIILGIKTLASGMKHVCRRGYNFSVAAIAIPSAIFILFIIQIVLVAISSRVGTVGIIFMGATY